MTIPRLKSPVYTHLTMTYTCNWRCSFCDIRLQHFAKPFAEHRTYKKIIDRLVESEVFEMSFYGGECFLYSKILELAEYAKGKGLNIGFVSNGSTIKEHQIPQIIEIFDGGSFSLHGFKDVHDSLVGVKGAHDKVVRVLEKFAEHNFPITICTTVLKTNYTIIREFINFMLSKYPNIHCVYLNNFLPFRGYQTENRLSVRELHVLFEDIYFLRKRWPTVNIQLGTVLPFCIIPEQYKDLRVSCWTGIAHADINFNGEVKICSESQNIVGNLLSESLISIWKNSEILRELYSLQWMPQKCQKCFYKENCLGGCRVLNADKRFSPDPYHQYGLPFSIDVDESNHVEGVYYSSFPSSLGSKRIAEPSDFSLKKEGVMVLSNGIKIREENIGWLVYVPYMGVFIVNYMGYQIIRLLSKGYNINEIQIKLSGSSLESSKVWAFVKKLLIMGIIKPLERR